MSAKRWGMVAVTLLAGIGSAAVAILWAAQQVPDFYETALLNEIAPAVRQAEAREFTERIRQLSDDLQHAEEWSQEFTEQQINSWFAEELQNKYGELIPKGIEKPRIRLIEGGALLGFRYRQDRWKGVVSARLKAKVLKPDQLAIRIEVAQAGLLPIPIDSALDEIVHHLQDERWRVEWDSHNEGVLLVSFDGENVDRGALSLLEIAPGIVRIGGRNIERTPPRPD